MNPSAELQHLDSMSADDVPNSLGLVELRAVAPGHAPDVLARVHEVIRVVLVHTPSWPDLAKWRTLLPNWFLKRFAGEESQEEAEQWLQWWHSLADIERAAAAERSGWSLSGWLYWMQPQQRMWFWWSSCVVDPDMVEVVVEVSEYPTPMGTLQWLFRVAGADSLTEEVTPSL